MLDNDRSSTRPDHALDEATVPADPLALFRDWFEVALATDMGPGFDPTAMTLATADDAGAPSARMVLLKEHDENGFVFYTHYASRKSRELASNPRAALVFYWPALKRQVRIAGTVSKVGRDQSQQYFQSRERGSQLSAAVSPQSRVIGGLDELEAQRRRLEAKCAGGPIDCPPDWGGYRLGPEEMEFWLSRPERLHDRLRYSRKADGTWLIERLAP